LGIISNLCPVIIFLVEQDICFIALINNSRILFAEYLKSSLKILFEENSQYRREIEDSILLNIERLVAPCIEKLKSRNINLRIYLNSLDE